uniref:titin-like n=1 Tax=Erigeron canadensis TaxID=72917 RepID=UPI001CB9BEE7|nr:titin-like [Erigeron canadensis]
MGRPPSNGGPTFRFNQAEIAEMESILQAHKVQLPERQVLVSLAEKFSNSEDRKGKIEVQMKQVWNWFQNRRYAIRAKQAKSPGSQNMPQADSGLVKAVPMATQPHAPLATQPHAPLATQPHAPLATQPHTPLATQPRAPLVTQPHVPLATQPHAPLATQPHAASSATVRNIPQAPQQPTVPSAPVRTFPQPPQHLPAFSGRVTDNSQMEYEAKSARDGAWYDVSTFLSHRSLEGDPEVLVRFAGFGAEEDEWVNVRKNVRQRSLPCEASECVAVLPSDLILCFQEGKEQALYFDAHVLDAQRRRHDVRGCRCRFLVRYDHDQSEEIVALRKICRRPETDYRLQQLQAMNGSLSVKQNKNGATNNVHTVSTLRVYPPAEAQPKQHKVEPHSPAEAPQKRQRLDSPVPVPPPGGSQTHLKVEPAVQAAPLVDVPQNQQTARPAVPSSNLEMPQYQHIVESVPPAPSAQQTVEPQKAEPVVPSPSDRASLKPKKVEPVSSAQGSAESQSVAPMGSTPADEAPVELQKVQPVMPNSSGEVSVEEPHKVKAVLLSSDEVKEETQIVKTSVVVPLTEASEERYKAEPAASGETSKEPQSMSSTVPPSTEISSAAVPSAEAQVKPCDGEPVVAESQEESVVPDSAVEVPSELHEVQPDVPDQPHTNALESKTEKSAGPIATNDGNVAEKAIETKTEEPMVPVSGNDHNVVVEFETKIEEPVGSASTNEHLVVKEAIETKTEQSMVHVSGNEPVETKPEEPVVTVATIDPMVVEEAIKTQAGEPVVPVSMNEPNVVEAVSETKVKEPLPTNDPNAMEAENKQPQLSEKMENNDGHLKVAVNVSDNKVENSELPPEENAAVAMEEG